MFLRKYILLLIIFIPVYSLFCQDEAPEILRLKVVNGDTVYYEVLPEVYIFPKLNFKDKRDLRRYRRLIRDVKKVYPYAKIAGQILLEFDDKYNKLKTDIAKKKYAKEVEDELKAEFEAELKKLTINQGMILMKLVYRETGNSTYDIVKQFRGSVPAWFYQALARLFGHDMKISYDPYGEDRIIEEIVKSIDRGEL
jgi:hypothetical protein